jgi:radical SAM protein with 4Fe4S-binding SPASM domain
VTDAPEARPRRSLPLAAPAQRGRPLDATTREIDLFYRPTYVVWEITLACDLACHHCGSRAGRARPDELSTEEALDLVDQMAALGVTEVTVIGGEAYLRDDWTKIIARIASHGMRAGMATGGRGLTRERAARARDAGLAAVSVSVDGLAEVHDEQRGLRGSFDAAMAAMENVRAVGGMRLTANSQVNRKNLHQLPELFTHLMDQGAKAWQVQLTAAMGRAADEPRIFLEPYQVLRVHPTLVKLRLEADKRGVAFWAGNNIGYFGPFESILRRQYRTGNRGSCGAGKITMGIEANGDIKGCPSLPTEEYVGGNIRDHSLRDIWERSAQLRFTRDMKPTDLRGFCAGCYYADECRGGCHWTSHVLLGDRGDNPYCHHRALELMREGVRERVVLAEPAPGMPFDHARYEIVREPWPESERRAVQALHDEVEALLAAHGVA